MNVSVMWCYQVYENRRQQDREQDNQRREQDELRREQDELRREQDELRREQDELCRQQDREQDQHDRQVITAYLRDLHTYITQQHVPLSGPPRNQNETPNTVQIGRPKGRPKRRGSALTNRVCVFCIYVYVCVCVCVEIFKFLAVCVCVCVYVCVLFFIFIFSLN
eukprot:GHVR01043665.1.p1 GENE.GHVR01043665.1~~GHVR01043665.1.p1  ORF type:complete len:165 (+),score=31.52 GHVR01043665.1:1028-1522(+)